MCIRDRDNIYKARIKILLKAEGEKFTSEVDEEFERIKTVDGAPHTLTQAELDRVSSCFEVPQLSAPVASEPAHSALQNDPQYKRWLEQNVTAHRLPHLRAVTLSFKRSGLAPGDATPEQLLGVADLAERFSGSELSLIHI